MNTFKLNKTDGFYYAPPIGPTEELNYTLDMVRDLDGDTIASVTWTVPAGITKDSDSFSGTEISVRLKNPTPGQGPWIIQALVTGTSGQKYSPYFKIAIRAL